MSSKLKTAWILVISWDRDGDRDGSPNVIPYSTLEAARKGLKKEVETDRETGILHNYYNPDEKDDWIIIDEPDHFHAKNGDHNVWVDFEIVEKEIQE